MDHREQQQQQQRHDGTRQFVGRAVTATASRVLVNRATGILQESQFQYHGGQHQNQYYNYPYYPYPPEEAKFIGIIPWTMKILRFCAVGLMLLCSSVVWYGVFYWAVMPGNYASRPLFFDYTGTVAYPHHSVVALDPTTTQKNAKSKAKQVSSVTSSSSASDSCTAYTPWATVDLFAREQAVIWGETTHPDLLPPQETKDRVLQPKQGFYVEVYLTLPESNLNRQVGMFGVAVDLLSQPSSSSDKKNNNGGTALKLASSVRSARLPHESGWLAIARKMVWIVPIIFGGMQESQTVVISSFRHTVESKEYPLRHVVVRIVGQNNDYLHSPQSPHQSEQQQTPKPPIEVIGGEIRIGKELNTWQQVLKDNYYLCNIIGTLIFFGAHLGVWAILQYYFSETEDYGEPYLDPSFDFDGDNHGGGGGEDDDGANNDNNSFESLHSGRGSGQGSETDGHEREMADEMQNDTGISSNDYDDNNFHSPLDDDEQSEDWEECSPEEVELASVPPQEEQGSHLGQTPVIRPGQVDSGQRMPSIVDIQATRDRSALVEGLSRNAIENRNRHSVILGHQQCRQTHAARVATRPKTRIPDKRYLFIPPQQAKVSSERNIFRLKPDTKATTEKACKTASSRNHEMETFYDCEDSSDETIYSKIESPSLLTASVLGGCSGSTASTRTPKQDTPNIKAEAIPVEQSTAPPFSEVKFTRSRSSLEPSPIDARPVAVFRAEVATSDSNEIKLITGSKPVAPRTTTSPSLLTKFKGIMTGTKLKSNVSPKSSERPAREAPASLLASESHLKDPPFSQSEESLSSSFVQYVQSDDASHNLLLREQRDAALESSSGTSWCLLLHLPNKESASQTKESASIPLEPHTDIAATEVVVRSSVDEIFHLPEAQILDSLLRDLINPFVR